MPHVFADLVLKAEELKTAVGLKRSEQIPGACRSSFPTLHFGNYSLFLNRFGQSLRNVHGCGDAGNAGLGAAIRKADFDWLVGFLRSCNLVNLPLVVLLKQVHALLVVGLPLLHVILMRARTVSSRLRFAGHRCGRFAGDQVRAVLHVVRRAILLRFRSTTAVRAHSC